MESVSKPSFPDEINALVLWYWPVGDGMEQKMLKIRKDKDGVLTEEEFGTFKFVPMLERKVR